MQDDKYHGRIENHQSGKSLEFHTVPFILPYPITARPLRVKHIDESDWNYRPEQILPSPREHHPFLSSVDRCAVSHNGGDGSERR